MVKKLIALTMVVALAGCSGSKENGEVIARVNGVEITAQQFQAYLDFKRIKVRDEAHRELLLDQYLERQGLSILLQSKQDEKEKLLAQAELEDFQRQMTISRYFERHLKEEVTDEKIRNYYVGNPDKYSQEKVHVAHILLRLRRDMSEAERRARLTQINEMYSRLKAGADFAEMARAESEDSVSAGKGGDLGWMKKGAIDTQFSEQMFALGKNEISAPFETPFGYHIIKVLEPAKTTTQSLESVTGDIRYLLRQQVKQAHEDELEAELKIERVK